MSEREKKEPFRREGSGNNKSHSHRVLTSLEFSEQCQIEIKSYQSCNVLIGSPKRKETSAYSRVIKLKFMMNNSNTFVIAISCDSICLSITRKHRESSCLLSYCDAFTTFTRHAKRFITSRATKFIFRLRSAKESRSRVEAGGDYDD